VLSSYSSLITEDVAVNFEFLKEDLTISSSSSVACVSSPYFTPEIASNSSSSVLTFFNKSDKRHAVAQSPVKIYIERGPVI